MAFVRQTRVEGHDALILENGRVRATVLPTLGGRVWELEDRVRGRQWIWHRPGVRLVQVPPGTVYDDVWAGGWEELFPNDAPVVFEGRELPDHGEWWAQAWRVTDRGDGEVARVRLEARCAVRQAHCVKEFSLARESDSLTASYRIVNEEREGFHFLFKQHFPVALTPSCRLVVPGGTVHPVDPAFGTLLPGSGPYPWPLAAAPGSTVDLSRIPPPESRAREFVYVTGVEDGWCGVEDPRRGAALRMQYSSRDLPYLWLFLTYGGWRDCYTAVLEPCTNMPKDLVEATRRGQAGFLGPGEAFTTSVRVTLGDCGRAA
jgi:hypothetical protein